MRILKFLILLPIAVLVIIFCVANRDPVAVSLNPFTDAATDTDLAALSFHLPLYVWLFAFLLLGVLLGGMAAWLRQGKWRQKARSEAGEAQKQKQRAEEAEQQMRQLAPDEGRPHPLLPALK